jgi:hypothetical protein
MAVRDVFVVSHACLAPVAPARSVFGFDPVAAGLPRKSLKTMTRAVQLGVAAVLASVRSTPGWELVPPERRGLFVGASPQQGDPEDLADAIAAAGPVPDLGAFAAVGVPLVPPLWLVKGLSNNVLGYASALLDLRGDNGNWCDGRLGGAVALCNAVHAVAEGRVDLAVAGGAEALVGAEAIFGVPCAEGAAFFVLVPAELVPALLVTGAARRIHAGIPRELADIDELGELGAAALPVALARALARGRPFAAAGLRVDPDTHS